MENNKTTLVWTLSLIGFPISLVLIILKFIVLGPGDENELGYIIFMTSLLSLIIFSIINIAFSFYSLSTFWKELTYFKILWRLFLIFTINAFSAYFL